MFPEYVFHIFDFALKAADLWHMHRDSNLLRERGDRKSTCATG